jgi:hypothetical protein
MSRRREFGSEGRRVEVPGGLTADLIGQISVLNLVTVAGALDLTIRPAGPTGI